MRQWVLYLSRESGLNRTTQRADECALYVGRPNELVSDSYLEILKSKTRCCLLLWWKNKWDLTVLELVSILRVCWGVSTSGGHKDRKWETREKKNRVLFDVKGLRKNQVTSGNRDALANLVTLYRRQGSRPPTRSRNAKRQNGCLRRPYK